MFERFTAPARQAVTKAVEQSRELGAHAIGSEHLLLGLLAQPHSAAAGILADLWVRPDDLRRAVRNGEFIPTHRPWKALGSTSKRCAGRSRRRLGRGAGQAPAGPCAMGVAPTSRQPYALHAARETGA